MNTIRLIAIAFPVMLLITACGGGGGGGGTPTTMMPGTNGPMTTPDPMTTPTVMLEPLPGYAITDTGLARRETGGTPPTASNTMSETAIVTEIQRIATAADTFEFRGFTGTPSASITCNANKSCSGDVPDVGMLTFSLNDIEDLSLIDDTNLIGFNSDTQAVMLDRGATLIQSQAAGRQSDGTQLTFQTYGGWVTNSVFGVQFLDVTENGTTTSRFASFSFGKASGSRPPGTALVRWNGSMVGVDTNKDIIQGDSEITIDFDGPGAGGASIASIHFGNIINIRTGNSVANMLWSSIPVETDGTFSSTTGGDINGVFYGDGSVAGGTFNRDNIIGAFGAKK